MMVVHGGGGLQRGWLRAAMAAEGRGGRPDLPAAWLGGARAGWLLLVLVW